MFSPGAFHLEPMSKKFPPRFEHWCQEFFLFKLNERAAETPNSLRDPIPPSSGQTEKRHKSYQVLMSSRSFRSRPIPGPLIRRDYAVKPTAQRPVPRKAIFTWRGTARAGAGAGLRGDCQVFSDRVGCYSAPGFGFEEDVDQSVQVPSLSQKKPQSHTPKPNALSCSFFRSLGHSTQSHHFVLVSERWEDPPGGSSDGQAAKRTRKMAPGDLGEKTLGVNLEQNRRPPRHGPPTWGGWGFRFWNHCYMVLSSVFSVYRGKSLKTVVFLVAHCGQTWKDCIHGPLSQH